MSKTLLLADDSITIQRVVELTFAQENMRVVAVSDGDQAVKWMEHDRPDIVLADVGMPHLDGYGVAVYVKQSLRLRDVPVLLLTGAFEPLDEDRARQSGCDGIMVKPFEPQHLVSRVMELLNRPAPTTGADAAAETGGDRTERLDVGSSSSPARLNLGGSPDSAEAFRSDMAPLDHLLDLIDLVHPREAAADTHEHAGGLDSFEVFDPVQPVPDAEPLDLAQPIGAIGAMDALDPDVPPGTPAPEWSVPFVVAPEWDLSPIVPHAAEPDAGVAIEDHEDHTDHKGDEDRREYEKMTDATDASTSAPSAAAELEPVPVEAPPVPPAPAMPMPTATTAPLPAVTGPVTLASAFSALLAAEHLQPQGPMTLTEADLENVVRRVLLRVTDEVVRQIVLDAAERLIREEIDKIKASPDEFTRT